MRGQRMENQSHWFFVARVKWGGEECWTKVKMKKKRKGRKGRRKKRKGKGQKRTKSLIKMGMARSPFALSICQSSGTVLVDIRAISFQKRKPTKCAALCLCAMLTCGSSCRTFIYVGSNLMLHLSKSIMTVVPALPILPAPLVLCSCCSPLSFSSSVTRPPIN